MRAAVLVLLVGAAAAFVERAEWNNYKLKHGKSYANPIEEFYRMKVYSDSKAYVAQHMAAYAEGKHTYTVALNQFSDLTADEWSRLYKGLRMGSTMPHSTHRSSGGPLPDTVDWRALGYVTSVKNQNSCGSCWSFAALGALEGVWAKAGNELVSLSAQQLDDCSRDYGNFGCMGGYMDSAYDYILDNGGIATEADYPYTGVDSKCLASPHRTAPISGYTHIPRGDEAELADAVANAAPVAIAMDASHYSFSMYASGIYNEPLCSSRKVDLDHTLLVVGYGDGYWIMKNSWGTSWGDEGYILMTRDGSNQCGVATQAYYPYL